jgi:hypothetical protein
MMENQDGNCKRLSTGRNVQGNRWGSVFFSGALDLFSSILIITRDISKYAVLAGPSFWDFIWSIFSFYGQKKALSVCSRWVGLALRGNIGLLTVHWISKAS